MVAKKTETFTIKTAGELKEGDRFRSSGKDKFLQHVISVEKIEGENIDPETKIRREKEIVRCKTSIDGSVEEFFFTSFVNVEVEVLDG